METIKAISTLWGAVMVTGFVFVYAYATTHSAAPWYRSNMGRNLMVNALAVFTLSVVGLINRVDESVMTLDLSPYTGATITVGWFVIGCAYLWWIREVIVAFNCSDRKKERKDAKDAKKDLDDHP